MSDHLKGLLFTLLGVLILSPDALLIRLAGIDSWSLLVIRGLLLAFGMALISSRFDPAPLLQQYQSIGRTGIIAAVFFAASTLGFVNAISYTTVAYALVIVATAPLFAALFGWLLLSERLKLSTFLAIIAVLGGMGLVVGHPDKGSHWIGNLCAMVTAMCIAMTFVLNRKNKDVNMVPAISISGVLVALVALPFSLWPPLNPYTLMILLAMGVVITLAFALITVAARFIPAAEVSLILPLETVGGTALVWLFLGETPGTLTLVGATIILASLTAHSYFSLQQSRTQSQ